MTNPAADGARAAAHRLSTQHGPALIADVEAALHASAPTSEPDQYFDPVSLGALIVSAATLAWTIYKDLKKTTANPSPDTVARTVTTELRRTLTLTDQQHQVIITTTQETINVLNQPNNPPTT